MIGIEAANGKPVLIYYSYKHDRDRITEQFPARKIKTEKDISDWNDGNIPIGLAHPASCGHGLNLQSGGSTIIWFGLTWSLELLSEEEDFDMLVTEIEDMEGDVL